MRARTTAVAGRRVETSGEIVADGEVTASAVGLFIRPNRERLDKHEALIKERIAAKQDA